MAGTFLACGTPGQGSGNQTSSNLPFKAFISNPLQPGLAGTTPVLNIVDASKDVLSPFTVNIGSISPQPGLMALFPNKRFTLVFSAFNNSVGVVDNAREGPAIAGTTAIPAIALPDFTESMFVAPDNFTGYAAVPNAPVLGQQPGVVEVMNLGAGSIVATLAIPGAHYVVGSHAGTSLLAMGESSNTVTIIFPSLIGSGSPATVPVCCFDHPVGGIFSSDDSVAYIFECGPECGGTTAGITVLNPGNQTSGPTLPLAAATMALVSGNTMYVAGTPPGNPCPSGTAATVCGTLNLVDLGTLTVTNPAPIAIPDGYHTRMDLGANGQLFIGAKNCTNINIAPSGGNPGEVRGCLSIYNTNNGMVVIPPVNGNVTGLQAITNRSVEYVVQNGELYIYDTTTDKLQTTQIDIIGQAVDVKLVD